MKIYKVYDQPIRIKESDIEWFKTTPIEEIREMVVKFVEDNERQGWLIPEKRIMDFVENIKKLRNG